MSRWRRWVEERVTGPDVQHIVDTQLRVLEQVRGLRIDLERIQFVEHIEVEEFSHP